MLELISTVFVGIKHVERGARRTQENYISRASQQMSEPYGFVERLRGHAVCRELTKLSLNRFGRFANGYQRPNACLNE